MPGRQVVCDRSAAHRVVQLAEPAITAASTGLSKPQALLHTQWLRVCRAALQHCRPGLYMPGLLGSPASTCSGRTPLTTGSTLPGQQLGVLHGGKRWLVHRNLGAADAAEHTRNCADEVTLPLHCTSRVAADGICAQ